LTSLHHHVAICHKHLFYVMFRITLSSFFFFFFQAEDGIRALYVTGVQTCALPIYPTTGNTYIIWRGLETIMSSPEGDRLFRKVVIETIIARPLILRYYIWNFWNYLFGPPLLPYVTCVDCQWPPCFAADLPHYNLGGFMGAEVFSRIVGPDFIAEMAREHERAKLTKPYGEYLYADVRQIFVAKPFLTILLLASVLL